MIDSIITEILVFLINVIGITLIITVSISHVEKKIKTIFGLMTFLMFIWVNFAYVARLEGNSEIALTSIRTAWIVTPLLVALIYNFLLKFLRSSITNNFFRKIIYFFPLFISFLTITTNLIIEDVTYINGGQLKIIYGVLSPLYFIIVLGFVFVNFYVLLRKLWNKNTDSETQLKLKYLIVGLSIFFVFNSTFNLILPAFFDIVHLYEFGDYSTIMFLSLVAYATIRQRFFGAQVVFTTFLVVLVGSFLFANAIIITQTPQQRVINIAIAILFIPVGFMLIRYMLESLRALDLIKQKAKEQQDMMDVLAHEVKTPMSSMLLEAEYLENNVKEIMKDRNDKVITNIAESVSAMQRSGHQGMSIVNGLLEFTRVNNKRFQLSYSKFDLVDTTKRSVETFKKMVDKQNYKIKFESSIEDLTIEADQSRIQEAIEGLLTNAKKYGVDPQNGHADITVSVSKENENAVISVSDKGIGLTAQDKKSLGQKFYRGVGQTKRTKSDLPQPGGTGLGLFMINIIMDAHQGYLSFDSEGEDKGSIFSLRFPISVPENTNDKQE